MFIVMVGLPLFLPFIFSWANAVISAHHYAADTVMWRRKVGL
jgi:hypothetical protein